MVRKTPLMVFVFAAVVAVTAATSPANSAERLISHGRNAQDWSAWSGYAETGSGYTSATATWTVPSVSPTDSDTYSAAWVGVDGYGNSDLIQTGTDSNYVNGQAEYSAWWEIIPDRSIVISGVPIKAGDSITASVSKSTRSTWTISLKNNTTGRSWSSDKTYTGPGQSAEYVEEAPMVGGVQAPLADFSMFSFSNLRANGANPRLTSSQKIILRHDGVDYATPSDPNSAGDGFSVSYTG